MLQITYDPAMDQEGAREGLRIRYPVKEGMVEYTFVHSVVPETNCDIWRLSVVNALDGQGNFLFALTKEHAEWEMAIRLAGRPDFIGGYAHGDEIGEAPSFWLDGVPVRPEELQNARCEEFKVRVFSVGYDPSQREQAVLRHQKTYWFREAGVELEQEVEWIRDVRMDAHCNSYLSMMPPVKHDPAQESRIMTDSWAWDEEPQTPILQREMEREQAGKITVTGRESRWRFTMEGADYEPRYPGSFRGLITDNQPGSNYHKMYLFFVGGMEAVVPAGKRWHARTRYRIDQL